MGRQTTLVANVRSSEIQESGFLTVRDLVGDIRLGINPILRCSRKTLYTAAKDGRLPTPVKMWTSGSLQAGTSGPRYLAWPSAAIRRWVAETERSYARYKGRFVLEAKLGADGIQLKTEPCPHCHKPHHHGSGGDPAGFSHSGAHCIKNAPTGGYYIRWGGAAIPADGEAI